MGTTGTADDVVNVPAEGHSESDEGFPTEAQLRWTRQRVPGEAELVGMLLGQRCLLVLDEADELLTHLHAPAQRAARGARKGAESGLSRFSSGNALAKSATIAGGATAQGHHAQRTRAEPANASGGSSTSSRSVSSSARTTQQAAGGVGAGPLWAAWATREAVLKRMRLAQLLERLLEDCPGLRIAVGATMPVSVSGEELSCATQKRQSRQRHRRSATGRSSATSAAASQGTSARPDMSTTDSGDADGDALRHARLHIGPDGDVEYSVPALSSVEAGRLLAHLSARHARVVTMEEVFVEISGREPERPPHAPVDAWPQIRQALACREAGDAVACVLPLTPAVISEVARRLGSAAKPVPLLVAIRRVAKALANDRRVTECVGAVAAQRLKLQGRNAAALTCFPEPLEDAGGQASQAAVGSGGGALVVLAVGQPASAAVVEPAGVDVDTGDAADADDAGAELRGAHPWLAAMGAPPSG